MKRKMENIQKKKQMVIPGNLPAQLRVLDSSQRLYTPLFLASCCSSTPLFPSKPLEKTPSFPLTMLSYPRSTLPPYLFCSFFSFSDLLSQRSLLQPPFLPPFPLQPPFLLEPPFLLQPPFLSNPSAAA